MTSSAWRARSRSAAGPSAGIAFPKVQTAKENARRVAGGQFTWWELRVRARSTLRAWRIDEIVLGSDGIDCDCAGDVARPPRGDWDGAAGHRVTLNSVPLLPDIAYESPVLVVPAKFLGAFGEGAL
jgi:hypothetical protein